MDKPFELERRDVTNGLLGVLNNSYLPYSVKKDIVGDIYQSLEQNLQIRLAEDEKKYSEALKEGEENYGN